MKFSLLLLLLCLGSLSQLYFSSKTLNIFPDFISLSLNDSRQVIAFPQMSLYLVPHLLHLSCVAF